MAVLDLVNTHGDFESGIYTTGAFLIWPLGCEYFDIHVLDMITM